MNHLFTKDLQLHFMLTIVGSFLPLRVPKPHKSDSARPNLESSSRIYFLFAHLSVIIFCCSKVHWSSFQLTFTTNTDRRQTAILLFQQYVQSSYIYLLSSLRFTINILYNTHRIARKPTVPGRRTQVSLSLQHQRPRALSSKTLDVLPPHLQLKG